MYADDGTIVHVHESVTMAGGGVTTSADAEQRALAHAAGHGHDTAHLKALHLDPGALKPRVQYRVDPSARTLIEKPSKRGIGRT